MHCSVCIAQAVFLLDRGHIETRTQSQTPLIATTWVIIRYMKMYIYRGNRKKSTYENILLAGLCQRAVCLAAKHSPHVSEDKACVEYLLSPFILTSHFSGLLKTQRSNI